MSQEESASSRRLETQIHDMSVQMEIVDWLRHTVVQHQRALLGPIGIPRHLRSVVESAVGDFWTHNFSEKFRNLYSGVDGDAESGEKAIEFRQTLQQTDSPEARVTAVLVELGYRSREDFLHQNNEILRHALEYALAETESVIDARERFRVVQQETHDRASGEADLGHAA